MTINDLKNEKVGLCVSGGLDSRTVATRLKEEGIDVLCFTANLGQPDERDIEDVRKRMAVCGVETIIVDLRDAMAQACLDVCKYQAHYDGGYWNTTGIARAVTVAGLLKAMRQHGCSVLAHGATGRGNDQIRFERYTNVLAPEMKVYAPWRDPVLLAQFPGRTQMAEYLAMHGIDVEITRKKRYSTDSNLAGLSHEAEDLESLQTPMTIVEGSMARWPQEAPDESEKVTLTIEKGLVRAINAKTMTPLEIMETANHLGWKHGLGWKNALENRVLGTKSRGVYESPGMELIATAIQQVYMAVLDVRSTDLFLHLSRLIGKQIYEGRYFDPATVAARAALDHLASFASAKVTLELYKGNIFFAALTDCPASLYNEADSSMEASEGLNPVSSQGFVEIQRVEAVAMAKAGQIDQSPFGNTL
ncbi:MAG: argininosuccinate synthase [Lentisphaerae bacterium]|nr:MAG: argininosuccinate synthase [Lentisphaerota bacterium]